MKTGNDRQKPMSDCCNARTTVRNTKCYRLRYDLIQGEGDQVVNIPVLLGEGIDWQKLLDMAVKVKVEDVTVRVKPWDDFITPGGEAEGYVSGDYPIYMVMIDGNTLNDNEAKTISTAALSGRYAQGRRTTGLTGTFGDKLYLTTYKNEYEEGVEPVVQQKTTTDKPIDSEQFTSKFNLYQSGKILVGINPENFKISNEMTSTAAAKAMLRKKAGKAPNLEAIIAQTPKKSTKKNPAPKPDYSKIYKDTPIEGEDGKDHLYVDYNFWVETSANVRYQIRVPEIKE